MFSDMDPRHIEPGVVGGEPPKGFELDIRGHGFVVTEGLRQYAHDHVAAKLVKHARAIQAVVIRFEDFNGPKRGEDKSCGDVFFHMRFL